MPKTPLNLLLAFLLLMLGKPLYAESPSAGTIEVTIKDIQGDIVQAPVYIYCDGQDVMVDAQLIPGTQNLAIPPGDYHLFSALAQPAGPYIDRFASREAHIHVASGDLTSVILTLMPLPYEEEPITMVQLQKMGIDLELARYTN